LVLCRHAFVCALAPLGLVGWALGPAQGRMTSPQRATHATVGEGKMALSLSADTLAYALDHCASASGKCPMKLVLRGHVRASAGIAKKAHACRAGAADQTDGCLLLHAGRLDVRLDERGTPVLMRASSGVQLLAGGYVARSRRARVTPSPWRIRLDGDVALTTTRSPMKLSGESLDLDLSTQQVTVHKASAIWTTAWR